MATVRIVDSPNKEPIDKNYLRRSDPESALQSLLSISENHDIEKALKILDAKNWTNGEEFLIPWGAQGITLAHLAAYRGNLEMLKRAVALRANLHAANELGKSALHYAAHQGHVEVVKWLLKLPAPDAGPNGTATSTHPQQGWTPLYAAACRGHLKCVRVLVDNGESLAFETRDGETAIGALLKYGSRAMDLLKEILDAQVYAKDVTANVILDFRALAPQGEFQMAVISALIRAIPNTNKMRTLHHPLLEVFLRLKWSRFRHVFYILVAVQCSFVSFLVAYALILLKMERDPFFIRWLLLVSACILLFHNLLQIFLVPRHYKKKLATWLSVICQMISAAVAVAGEFIPDTIAAEEGPEEVPNDLDKKKQLPSSIPQIACFTVPFLIIQVQLTIAQHSKIGTYILAFTSVLTKIFMVLVKCFPLISGFSVSFVILFNDKDQFSVTWKTVTKIAMMMLEDNYDDLFSTTEKISYTILLTNMTRIVFLMFVLLAGIASATLIVGLAINNIEEILEECNTRQLLNQAEFMIYCERLTSGWKLWNHWVPKRLTKILMTNEIDDEIELEWAIVYKNRSHGFSEELLDCLFDLASKNSYHVGVPFQKSPRHKSFRDKRGASLAFVKSSAEKIVIESAPGKLQRMTDDRNVRGQRRSL